VSSSVLGGAAVVTEQHPATTLLDEDVGPPTALGLRLAFGVLGDLVVEVVDDRDVPCTTIATGVMS